MTLITWDNWLPSAVVSTPLLLALLAIGASAVAADEDASAGAAPKGMVAFFNRAECPSGWTTYTSAEGRYIVGVLEGSPAQQKERVGKTQGTPLSDLESRPTGSHVDALNGMVVVGCTSGAIGIQTGSCAPGDHGVSAVEGHASSAGPEGTNAPYVQLLACEKK